MFVDNRAIYLHSIKGIQLFHLLFVAALIYTMQMREMYVHALIKQFAAVSIFLASTQSSNTALEDHSHHLLLCA